MLTDNLTAPRILIVEDDHSHAALIRRFFQGAPEEYHLVIVNTLSAAKSAIERQSPSLVLTDYRLSDGNGSELVVIAAGLWPVIIMTAQGSEKVAVETMKLGALDYIVKSPETFKDMPRTVNYALMAWAVLVTRKQATDAIFRAKQEWERTFDAVPDLIAIIDLDQTITRANKSMSARCGVPQEEIVGRKCYEVMHAFSNPHVECPLAKMKQDRSVCSECIEEKRLKSIFEITVSPLYNSEGLLTAYVHIARDVTEQKRADENRLLTEEALRYSEERFRLAMQGANEGLWDWDIKNGGVYFSPRWKSMLGYGDEELENHFDTWKRLIHPEDQKLAMAHLSDFLESRSGKYEVECRMLHKEGYYLDILSKGFSVYSDQGEVLRMIGTHVDITECKKLEAQYRQSQKLEAIGQLAGGVAHDFNNLLSAIVGYSQLSLIKLQGNDLVKSHIEQILMASEKATVLTQSLLAFSRKQKVNLAAIDLSKVVNDFEIFLKRLIREDIELKVSCNKEPLIIMVDRGQIEQVIMNLVTNGRDAMPSGGKLCIETRSVTMDQEFVAAHGYGRPGVYAVFSVADNGIGMDKETQAHIFEPFYTTKELGKGTGLGLAMAYGIIKKHDGFISVDSEPERGTIFEIYLPAVADVIQVDEIEPKVSAALRAGMETILVCEDNTVLRDLAVNVLREFGYRVIEAVDGQDAIEKFVANKESIDLVFIDAIMPKMNGKEANDAMKMVRSDLKTIFVSGYTKDIFKGDAPFDENTIFIHKPYSPNDLLIKMRELLDKKNS